VSAGGGALRGCQCIERSEQLGADHLGDRHRAADIADRILDGIDGRFLAVVQLFAVQVDLESTLADGRQRNADFAVTSGTNLGCQTDSLPEVPSRNAVLDLQMNLAFSHACDLLGSRFGAEPNPL
jgi:hypothetical protein